MPLPARIRRGWMGPGAGAVVGRRTVIIGNLKRFWISVPLAALHSTIIADANNFRRRWTILKLFGKNCQ